MEKNGKNIKFSIHEYLSLYKVFLQIFVVDEADIHFFFNYIGCFIICETHCKMKKKERACKFYRKC